MRLDRRLTITADDPHIYRILTAGPLLDLKQTFVTLCRIGTGRHMAVCYMDKRVAELTFNKAKSPRAVKVFEYTLVLLHFDLVVAVKLFKSV
jgi:hypothetical protein